MSTGLGLPRAPRSVEPIDRFWARIEKSDTDCWEWRGSRQSAGGYGRFWPDGRPGRRVYAHRWSYERFVGPIPEGLDIDHLCRNRGCVNPEHLEPVTRQVNVLRGESPAAQQAVRSECPLGHPLAGANLVVWRNHRKCRICKNASRRRARARNGSSSEAV